jgi:hypothetical protein
MPTAAFKSYSAAFAVRMPAITWNHMCKCAHMHVPVFIHATYVDTVICVGRDGWLRGYPVAPTVAVHKRA